MDTVFNLFTLFVVAAVALALVLLAVRGLDRWIFPDLSFEKALRENNMAVAVFLAALVFGIFFLASHAVAADQDRYDPVFKKYTRYYFGYTHDWRWFKAQGMTESGLDPQACSQVGACGLMQIMPGTAIAMGLRDRFEARASIRAGIAYDKRMWRMFSQESGMQRLWFALAAYNCGPGCVIRAQEVAASHDKPTDRWEYIAPHLPLETRQYVPRIRRWFQRYTQAG